MMNAAPLVDSFGRVHDNLRISVTDRCNIRCFYCMPETGVQFVERSEILDFEEIERFVRVAVALGITQAARHRRRTAGAPRSARTDPPPGRHPRHSRTSRSPPTACCCEEFAAAALRCRPAAPQRPSRHARPRALPADHAARRSAHRCWRAGRGQRVGFRIKLNAVAVKNLVEPDIVPLARFARENGFEVRYIEFMPLDAQNLWDRGKVLLGRRHHRDALARDLAAYPGARSRSARARHRNTATPMAAARSASSPRSAARSA